MKRFLHAAAALLLVLLSACAGTVGPRSAADPDVADAAVEADVYLAILEKLGRDALSIDVEVDGGRARLTGEVEKRATQELAEEVALSVPGVRRVENRVVVAAPADRRTPVGQAVTQTELEVQDAILEARVGRRLLAEIGGHALDLEVEATEGVVSLRGTVSDRDRKRLALRTAEETRGVKRVVDLLRVRGR